MLYARDVFLFTYFDIFLIVEIKQYSYITDWDVDLWVQFVSGSTCWTQASCQLLFGATLFLLYASLTCLPSWYLRGSPLEPMLSAMWWCLCLLLGPMGILGYFSLCSMARSLRVVPWHSPAHIHLGWQPPMQPLLPHRARFEDGHRLLLFLPTQMQKVSYIISSLL